MHSSAKLVPHSIVVRAADAEHVLPASQVGVTCIPSCTCRHPVLVNPHHHVLILIQFRRGIVKSSKLERDQIVTVGQLDSLAWDYLPLCSAIQYVNSSDDHLRRQEVITHLLRIKSIQALGSSKEHASVMPLIARSIVELCAL